MTNLDESIKNINNKNDLASFIKLLINDLKNNENEWENITLEGYLEAMSAWLVDSDGLSINLGIVGWSDADGECDERVFLWTPGGTDGVPHNQGILAGVGLFIFSWIIMGHMGAFLFRLLHRSMIK
jgi:hypothetical protein